MGRKNKVNRIFVDSEIGKNNVFVSNISLKLNKKIKKDLDLFNYPQTNSIISLVQEFLSKKYNINKENIMIGSGSVEIIKNFLEVYKIPFDHYSFQGYTIFNELNEKIKRKNKKLIIYPDINKFDLDINKKNLIKIINEYDVIDIAYLFNYFNFDYIMKIIKKYYKKTLFIFTFSKLLGLPGIRLGVAIGPKKIILNSSLNLLTHPSIIPVKSLEYILKNINVLHQKHLKYLNKKLKTTLKKLNYPNNENVIGFNKFNILLNKEIILSKKINNIYRYSVNKLKE